MVRIGAVNCQEDWGLCQRQGIRSYPSVILYPSVSGVFLSLSVFTLSWFSHLSISRSVSALFVSVSFAYLSTLSVFFAFVCVCLCLCLSTLSVSVFFACGCQLYLCLSSLLVSVSVFACVCQLCLSVCPFFCLSDLPAVSTCLPFCLSVMASTYIHVWLLWLASKQILVFA